MTVTATQRYTKNHPCPICGGNQMERPGLGQRCWGFISEDGKSATCEREEYGGKAWDWGYWHRLYSTCACGVSHNGWSPTPAMITKRESVTKKAKPEKAGNALRDAASIIDFVIKDVDGHPVAVHRRYNFADGGKTFRWFRADGQTMGIGFPEKELPLFSTEIMDGMPSGSLIVISEGETAALALQELGIAALATVTGAHSTHGSKSFEILAGMKVALWPDNDESGVGQEHMNKNAAILADIATHVYMLPPQGEGSGYDAKDYCATHARDEVIALILSAPPINPIKPAPPLERWLPEILADARYRLAEGLENSVGFTKAQAIADCGQRFMAFECSEGHRLFRPKSCGIQLCPFCGPKILARDWWFKIGDFMASRTWRLREARPVDELEGADSFRKLRRRLSKMTDRAKRRGTPANLVYGTRFEAGMKPLLMLIEDASEPGLTNKEMTFTTIRPEVTGAEALRWLQDSYQAEVIEAWDGSADLALLYGEAKGRHRFQAIGPKFQGVSFSLEATVKKTAPPSGGSGHGGGGPSKVMCPIHTEKVLRPLNWGVTFGQLGSPIGKDWFMEKGKAR